ncbi:MAG: aminotransferase class I/II-fold pyridoxal phosphate-dependent enzyme [Chlamydiota bacterium]
MKKEMTSATAAINALTLAKRSRGETVYNFAAGDPILPSHPAVIEAVTLALQSELVLYPPVVGLDALRKEALLWMGENYGACYGMQNTLVTAGGKFALLAAMQAIVSQGDEVIIASPYWVSYPQMVELLGAKPVIARTEAKDGWKLNVKTLEKCITERSRVLILNNAANPTGILYAKEELESLMECACKKGLIIISDEVYSEIIYDHEIFISCGAFEKWREQVIVVQSCSKNFAMTGWRIGFAFGPERWIREMTAIQSQSTSGPSTVSQWAAIAALKERKTIILTVRKAMQKRRDLFVEMFNEQFYGQLPKPSSGLYAFIPLSIFNTEKDSAQMCNDLITTANIACVPGVAFGQEGYMRMAFSEKREVLKEGLITLRKEMGS